MKDPLSILPVVKKYQIPLTDDGVTWNGSYILVSEARMDELKKLLKDETPTH